MATASPLAGPALPAGLSMKPDGEQQQERFVAEGRFRFERQWRQALTADEAGRYVLPPDPALVQHPERPHPRRRACPHILWCSRQGERHSRLPAPGVQYLYWVLLAILLRAFMRRHWPRWRAFYRLQRPSPRALLTRPGKPC